MLFWIWCYGFFATAIKFSRSGPRPDVPRGARHDDVQSGPMFYLRDGLQSPALAMTYAVVAGIAALTTTPFTQTNSIALVMNTQVGMPLWVSGVSDRRAHVAGDHRRHQVDRPRVAKLAPLKVGLLPGSAASS